MPACYKIDKERRLVMSTAYGVVTRQDLQNHQEALLVDPDFGKTFSQLADFTRMTRMEVTAADVRVLAAKNVFAPEARRAFIASDEAAFGLSRMFEILRAAKGEEGIRVFRTVEEGFAWIFATRPVSV
jgi:hypothetical protein